MEKTAATFKGKPSVIVGSKKQKNWWVYLVFVFATILYIMPFYILINMSLREVTDLSSRLFLPLKYNWQNYVDVFNDSSVWQGFLNSALLAVETVFLEVLIGSLAAYGVARSKNKFTEGFRLLNMTIMMIPGTALLVGTYQLMVSLGLLNSITGLAIMSAAGGLTGTIFFYTNFISAIPPALDEAAEIDGAGVIRTFYWIIFPQLKPITVTRIIMSFIGSWNNYLMPMYLLTKANKFTIILVAKLAFSTGNGAGNLPLGCATCTVAILPIIILYLFLQKYIIEGQLDSAVK